jgi:integrase
MRYLRAVWNLAQQRAERTGGPPRRNPVSALSHEDAWFDDKRRDNYVSADALPEFYKAASELENRTGADFLRLLLFTGLRRNEAARLRWEKGASEETAALSSGFVDFKSQAIRLSATKTKNGQRLDLPMSDLVRDLLVARRSVVVESEWVFPGERIGSPLNEPKTFFYKIAGATGIRVSAHDLRRTFITVASDVAISGLQLKALVNHSLGSDVTEGYARITVDQLRRPAQMIADRLRELCEIERPETVAENVVAIAAS